MAACCRCRSLTYGILKGYKSIFDRRTLNRELIKWRRVMTQERFCSRLYSSDRTQSAAIHTDVKAIHGEVSVTYHRGLPVVTIPLPSRRERCRFTLRPVTHTVADFLRHVQNEDKGIDRIGVKTLDGVRVAAATSIESLMQEDFHLVVNDVVYHVSPPPSERLTHEQLEHLSNVRHVVSVLYEALSVDEHQLRKERELLQKLEDFKYELEPLEDKKKELALLSNRRTNFVTWLGLGLMATQFGILARLTWWEYSWDIMEPVTYFVTYGTSMAAYAYFVVTKQDYILPDVKDRQFLITFYKQAKKIGLDVERYNELKDSIAVIERDISRLRDPLYLHLPRNALVNDKLTNAQEPEIFSHNTMSSENSKGVKKSEDAIPRGLMSRGGDIVGQSARLPSLRMPRDLTLGGVPKRTFKPTFAAAQKPKTEPKTETVSPGTGPGRNKSRSRGGERERGGGRGRGRGRGQFVQMSGGLFSEGTANILPKKSQVCESVNSKITVKPRYSQNQQQFNTTAEQTQYEEEQYKLLMRDDFIDDGDLDLNADAPIQLPLLSPTLKVQKKVKQKAAVNEDIKLKTEECLSDAFSTVKIKSEPMDIPEYNELDSKASEETELAVTPEESSHDDEFDPGKYILELLRSGKEEIMLFRLPDDFPSLITTKDDKPVIKQEPGIGLASGEEDVKSSVSQQKNENTLNWREGSLGKMRILESTESTKTQLIIGDVKLNLSTDAPVGFLQDLVSLKTTGDAKELVALGHIGASMVCVPELSMEMLLLRNSDLDLFATTYLFCSTNVYSMVMVMETPSPQIVGLQFVREYYTMLNQAPEHLHRFYNSNSSFVHGSLDQGEKTASPVYGQQEIHKRIMQLNFRDCHARILLVDSQDTLGDGVVVQVTGELSNDQAPMRRFMQTFVLALQSPKKYYVHNDILRYQDEVFADDSENDVQENSVENECEVESPSVNETRPNQDIHEHYYQRPLQNGSTARHEVSPQLSSVPTEPVQESILTNLVPVIPPQISTVPATVTVNSSPASILPQVATPPSQPEPEVSSDAEKPEYVSQDEEDYHEKTPNKSPEPTEERSIEPAADEPKTYATMLTKNPGGGSFSSPPNAANVGINSTAGQKNFHNTSSPIRPEIKADNFSQQQQRPSRPNNKGPPGNYQPRDRLQRAADDSTENERRRPLGHYPDNQQLFVGNLPYDVDETALRKVFAEYGNVVDMRINTKPPMMKGGNLGGRNFGFIVFDDPNTVTTILSTKQTHYLGDLRLNVEEKKARVRMGNNDMRPSMGGRGGGNMGRISGPMMSHRGGGNHAALNDMEEIRLRSLYTTNFDSLRALEHAAHHQKFSWNP
ncbi:hypothetical protein CHUAL_002365 [Chamberlinius hualienensis]